MVFLGSNYTTVNSIVRRIATSSKNEDFLYQRVGLNDGV